MRKRAVIFGLAGILSAGASNAVELDPTFGDRGIVTDFSNFGGVGAMVIQPDRKTLIAGSESGSFRLTRFSATGDFDLSFGVGGAVTGLPFPGDTYPGGMVLLLDGRFLVASTSQVSSERLFLVARFLPNGGLDATFGSSGYVTLDFPGGGAVALAMAVQPDGRIVVTGGTGPATPFADHDFAVARFDPNGAPDTTFGSGGRVVIDMGGRLPEFAEALLLETDGRMVLAGPTDSAAGSGCGMAGLRADGSLDPAFGGSGKLFPPLAWDCRALGLDAAGKILVGGSTANGTLLMRMDAGGVLDPSFGTGGASILGQLGPANALAVDSQGRIALAVAGSDFVFARFLPDGRPDPSVGPAGWTEPGIGGSPPHIQAHASEIATMAGATIIGGDRTVVTGGYATLVRYLDDEFSTIPTLSEWGTVVLAALLALSALFIIRRGA